MISFGRAVRLARVALLLVCVVAVACVSRNVERIDEEEAATMEAPPAPTAAGEQPPPVESGTAITGTLSAAPDVATIPDGTLYLIVRVAGRETGAPLAVKRLGAAELPVEFSVSEADAMIPGTPLVGELDVIARLDQDGDAFTEEPGDLQGQAGPVEAGDEVEIELRPVTDGAGP